MTIPTIGTPARVAPPVKEPVTNDQVFKAIAFVTAVLPTTVALNVLLWTVAASLWGAR